MRSILSSKYTAIPSYESVSDFFSAIFGPATVVMFVFSLERIYFQFDPYVNVRGLDGFLYLGLQVSSRLFILSLGAVYLLKFLSAVKMIWRVPWDTFTPPFQVDYYLSRPEVSNRIIGEAKQICQYFLGASFILPFIFPVIGYVPLKGGALHLPRFRALSPQITLPSFISQFPILGDLIPYLGDFLFSPNNLGYGIIIGVMFIIVIGFWNLTYLFLNRRYILNDLAVLTPRLSALLKWLPYIGVLFELVLVHEFGFYWFLNPI